MDYSLKLWAALLRCRDDSNMLVDNDWIANRIRPWARGRRLPVRCAVAGSAR
ncbi:hypothetical protein [Azotobacter vinelandii]|uniref:hypothetical protein n=1 Tax=Azotobacter vinelandii TaxID=354 RepID=UPI0011148E3F